MTFLVGKVIEDKEITDPTECLVLVALADATNKETMICYLSLTRLSQVARCSLRMVLYVIKRLEKKGWIQVIRRKRPDGVHLANTYRIIKYGDLIAQAVHQGSAPDAVGVAHPVHDVAQNASKGSAPGALEPSLREPIKTNPESAPAPAREKRAKLAAEVRVLSLPLFLEGEDFRQALQDWVDHRIMLKIPMTQRGLEEVVKTCEQWEKATAISYIRHSIKKGWKDVYKPKDEPRPPKDKNDNF